MAEGTYEYECMRAELLGVDPPDYDEFMRKKKEQESEQVVDEEIDTENLKEAELQEENLKHVTGGLEELNNILSKTQKKIDMFKVRCGSITNLLKSKVGSFTGDVLHSHDKNGEASNSDPSHEVDKQENPTEESITEEVNVSQNGSGACQKKSDLSKALDNHNDRLDSMLEKAENAHFSMQHQNKQMKKFLQ